MQEGGAVAARDLEDTVMAAVDEPRLSPGGRVLVGGAPVRYGQLPVAHRVDLGAGGEVAVVER